MRLMRAACQRGRRPAVVVTHDAQLASWADRVVFIRDGRVVDQTAPPAGPESLLRRRRELASRPRGLGTRPGGGAGPARRGALGLAAVPARVAPAVVVLARAAASPSRRRSQGVIGDEHRASPTPSTDGRTALTTPGSSRPQARAGLATARLQFGTVDVIGHKSPVPGSAKGSTCAPRTPTGRSAGRCWRCARPLPDALLRGRRDGPVATMLATRIGERAQARGRRALRRRARRQPRHEFARPDRELISERTGRKNKTARVLDEPDDGALDAPERDHGRRRASRATTPPSVRATSPWCVGVAAAAQRSRAGPKARCGSLGAEVERQGRSPVPTRTCADDLDDPKRPRRATPARASRQARRRASSGPVRRRTRCRRGRGIRRP